MAKVPEGSGGSLADRIEFAPVADRAGLGALREEVDAAAVSAAPVLTAMLKQASGAMLVVMEGRSADPAATLAGAARLVRAALGADAAPPAVAAPPPPAAAPPPAPSPASTATGFVFDDADRELVADFVQEALDYIEQAEAAMLVLEGTPQDMEAVDTVFRSFHTVKGVSAMLGLEPIAKLAHRAESVLTRVRNKELRFSGQTADLSLSAVDGIKMLVAGVQATLAGEPWTAPDLGALSDALSAHASGNARPAPPPKRAKGKKSVHATQAVDAPPKDPPPETTSAAPIAPAPIAPAPIAPAPIAATAAPVAPPAPLPAQSAAASQGVARGAEATETSMRVRTERLDRLVDMVGELVIAHSMVRQDPTLVMGDHHDLSRKVAHAGKIVRELQELAMSLRMVPLRPTFQKMARVVRDTAQKSGKEVELTLSGEDTEIDRNMVDIVADPLVHMLRNAVDHGIETPAEREAKGKRRNGTVRLSATHAGGNVVVELADDGAGLDRARIVRKAIERGLIESDNGLSDSDVFNLIFEPGFSTRDQVTDVSGRGVGMDVVRRNVQALNGRIEIASVLGQGTVFTLRLPLTLAVTDGMLVRVGSERYIVPIVNILTSLRPTSENIATVSGKGEILVLRGELIPLFRLDRLFSVQPETSDATRRLAVIVNGVEGRCALLVDELLGQQQVVAKSLGTAIGAVRGVAGGAILGDGRVGLILDTPEIIALAREESSGRSAEAAN